MPIHHYALSFTYCEVRTQLTHSAWRTRSHERYCSRMLSYHITYTVAIIYKTKRVSAVRLMRRIPCHSPGPIIGLAILPCVCACKCVRIWMIKANPIEVRSCHTVRMEAFVHVCCASVRVYLCLHAHRLPFLHLFLLLRRVCLCVCV